MSDSSLLSVRSANRADLPTRYVAAKEALAECVQVDECKEWADRAAAMASYARQSGDDLLEKYAQRIRGRATRRLGELLKLQKETVGLNEGKRGDRGPRSAPRSDARPTLAEVGVSKKLSSKAQRIAEMPEEEFEARIESADPPSISQLAARHELSRPKPFGFARATQAIGILKEFAEFCSRTDATLIASGIEARNLKRVRQHIAIVDGWLDRLSVHLQGD